MKKIIDGKLYDTETAECLHEYWNRLSTSDFKSVEETLYKTKKGTYFLHGRGGGLSVWAEHTGNGSGYGQAIVPMSEQEAIEWLETHEGDDVLLALFADKITEA